jgi:molecular chaperone HscB
MVDFLQQNYFELFRLRPVFFLDSKALSQCYRELQQIVHPDRFAAASEQERRLSMQHATHFNTAYQTLKHPLSRARYLLELQGVDIGESAVMEPEFLLQQMELREQLEALPQLGEPLSELMSLRQQWQQTIDTMQKAFAEQLANHDNEQALQLFYKLQFFYRLQEELDSIEERLLG